MELNGCDQTKKKEMSLFFSGPQNKDIHFPLSSFERLLIDIGFEPQAWFDYWLKKDGEHLASHVWPKGTRRDWIWGLALPLLSDIQQSLVSKTHRTILGISALPGCGKSSLGLWLEEAGKNINLSISVISLDDFYFPGELLQERMKGNPWDVPRGLPGSHDIALLEDTIFNWVQTGELSAPKFDKAMRGGLGDRSGWINANPDILILEGWFLGCNSDSGGEYIDECLELNLTESEIRYREIVQNKLEEYSLAWNKIDRMWHIKSIEFNSTTKWKVAQERAMLKERGSSLSGQALDSFLRMIQSAIPQKSLNNINSDATIKINESRRIIWAGKGSEEI